MVTVPIHISAVLYFLIGLAGLVIVFFPFVNDNNVNLVFLRITWGFMSLLCFGIIIFLEIVIKNIKKGKFWAWVAAICIAGLYIPSLFFLLGIIMLIGLMKQEVKDFCMQNNNGI